MSAERTETVSGATSGAPDRLSEGGDPFAAQDAARTVELPLAGRTMMDLGRQVAAWRATARAAEAERDRLRAALEEAIPMMQAHAAQNPKWIAYNGTATGAVQDPNGVHAWLAKHAALKGPDHA
jgi:hypothetical protein